MSDVSTGPTNETVDLRDGADRDGGDREDVDRDDADRDDGERAKVKPGSALCLSGGGYRAMVFHLGGLIRLNELGRLRHITRVSSVSGGSITAGVMALAWKRLTFDGDGPDAVCTNLFEEIIDPVRRFSERTVDIRAGVVGLLVPGLTPATMVAKAYNRHLFHGATLQDLPTDDEGPRFVINTTNMGTGKLMRFSRPYMADYTLGVWHKPTVELADAVAASSAFPPVLSPLVFKPEDKFSHYEPEPNAPTGEFRTRLVLTDGGVYDNLGLETTSQYRSVYASDGGGKMPAQERPTLFWGRHTYRVLSTIDDQVRSLRKRELVERYMSSEDPCTGALWTMRTNPHDPALSAEALSFEPRSGKHPAEVATRLAKLSVAEQEDLINWGYVLADATIRSWDLTSAAAPSVLPV